MNQEEKWDRRWLELAQTVATWSKDPSTKIGSVIVDDKNRIVSIGYNGFAEGVEDKPERWERPQKYEWVIHAEQNAIINARDRDVDGCTMYVTTHPCHRCIMHIINAGIKRIVWIKPTEDFTLRWLGSEQQTIFNAAIEEAKIITKVYG